MKKYAVVLVTAVFIFTSLGSAFSNDIRWLDIGRGNLDVKSVLVNPDNPSIIYTGANNGLFKTEDGAATWRNILQNRAVNFLLFDPKDKNSLFAATGSGLFYSSNQGNNWNRIFKGKNSLENECTALAVLPYRLYLGTKLGLFVSQDKGRSWRKEKGKIGNSRILAIAYNFSEPNYIYAACVDGVFKSKDSGESWERIFAGRAVEDNGEEGIEQEEDIDEAGRVSNIRYIICEPKNFSRLYLSTARGVYKSIDRGSSWELLSGYGLLDRDVQFLLSSPEGVLYAATKSGVFEYRSERWYELSPGLNAKDIIFLAQDKRGSLYAAGDTGLFKTQSDSLTSDKQDNAIALYSKDEPKIQDVQQAAIKYAEVESGKIKQWRKQAKMKAVLPKLTLGLDRSESSNYEIYTSATTKYIYEGPRDRSNGWDITLSWELGDLIWNDAQTSIDARSRLMVQLRDDVLDEVTKLYFERIRVKMELDNLSIEDRKKRFEKELKLQELTAQLDGLTGGYFSQQLKSRTAS